MNRFMFHSLEFIKQDEVCIFGAWGDYSIEISITSDGVEVLMPDFDKEDPTTAINVKKIFKDEFFNDTGEE